MSMKLDTRAFAIAGASAAALVAAACFSIYVILGQPDPWNQLFNGSGQSALGFLTGVGESAAVGALAGAVVSAVYNRTTRAS